MDTYYAKRALEILREEGPVELSKSTVRFTKHKMFPDRMNFRIQTTKAHMINRTKYDTYPNPFMKITVDPMDIEYRTTKLPHIDYNGIGRVKAGDWDRKENCEKVENNWVVRGLHERFVENKEWVDTMYYKYAQEKFRTKQRTSVRGANSLESFLNERCRFVDQLYQDIKHNGYREAGSEEAETHRGHYKDNLEVLIAIGRSGSIYMHKGGYHRFSIARILEIDVPVNVVCRHKQWQELRDEIHNNGVSVGREDLRDHPDLQDVLD